MSVDFVNQLESGGYLVLEVLEQPLDGRSSSSSICRSGAPASEDLSCLSSPGVDNVIFFFPPRGPIGARHRTPHRPAASERPSAPPHSPIWPRRVRALAARIGGGHEEEARARFPTRRSASSKPHFAKSTAA